MGLPGGSDSKQSACNAGDPGLISGSGRSPREGNGYPLQYSCLAYSMDRGAWWAPVHGVAKQSDRTEQLRVCTHTHTHTHIHTFSLVVLSVLCQIFPLLDIKFLENRNLFPSLIPPHQCFITPQPFKKMAVMLNCIPNFWPVPTVEA